MRRILPLALLVPLVVLVSGPASATDPGVAAAPAGATGPGGVAGAPPLPDQALAAANGQLPSPPPAPPGAPSEPASYQAPGTASTGSSSATASSAGNSSAGGTQSPSPPPQARTWGSPGPDRTLVLYDTTGTYGFLGEEYAMGAGNLLTHFGQVTAEPVVDYVAGQVPTYDLTVYLGSTYNEPIPTAFLNDALDSNRPVLWTGRNVWQLSGSSGSTANQAFQAKYGWDASTSYFDAADGLTEVDYHGQRFTRFPDAGGVLAPHITGSGVTTLASVICSASGATSAPTFADQSGGTGGAIQFAPATTCNSIAQTTGSSFPWAIRSANLLYSGEIPLSFIGETDRYLVFSDLLSKVLQPNATPVHDAMVRLEDVSAHDSATTDQSIMSYLEKAKIPFSVSVIPLYLDPNGYYTGGIPVSKAIGSNGALVKALKSAVSSGYGFMNQEGYSHQYSDPATGKGVLNPYDGVTADDFEFYRAYCSTTQTNPSPDPNGCPNADWVIEQGPLPPDTASWATNRINQGKILMKNAGLPAASNLIVPHYAGSLVDYSAFAPLFRDRYDRSLYFLGQLSTGTPDYSQVFGQFFPYQTNELDGSPIIPENLGDYEPMELNHHPPRSPADIVTEAQLNSVLTHGFASFFYEPDLGLTSLQQIVLGIQGLGAYTWVSPNTAYSQFQSFLSTAPALAPNPVAVTGVVPTSGPGVGGNTVYVEGSGFTNATQVLWGGQPIPYNVVTGSEIAVVAPAQGSLPSTIDIQVVNGPNASAITPADRYTYLAPPTITSVNPDTVSGSTPAPITITGTAFAGANQVNVCGIAEPFTVVSSTTITSTSPHTTYVGNCWITVTTPGGTSPQFPFTFTS